MADRYELTTLKDIFEKVPLDKIDECMGELAELIKQSKVLNAAVDLSVKAIAGIDEPLDTVWPEPVVWIDDSKGDITIKVTLNDARLGELKTKV